MSEQVTKLSNQEVNDLLKSGEETGKYAPLGLFFAYDAGKYIGIDNSTGNAWVEDFNDLETCFSWLLGTEEADTPAEMYKEEFMDWLRSTFDVSGTSRRLIENCIDYAEKQPQEKRHAILIELLSGTIGLTDDEIMRLKFSTFEKPYKVSMECYVDVRAYNEDQAIAAACENFSEATISKATAEVQGGM